MKWKELKMKCLCILASIVLHCIAAFNVGLHHAHAISFRKIHSTSSSLVFSAFLESECNTPDSSSRHDIFLTSFQQLGLTCSQQEKILRELVSSGLVEEETFESTALRVISQDLLDRPDLLSRILMQDFALSPLAAHITRAAALKAWGEAKAVVNGALTNDGQPIKVVHGTSISGEKSKEVAHEGSLSGEQTHDSAVNGVDNATSIYSTTNNLKLNTDKFIENIENGIVETESVLVNSETAKRPAFKAVHVAPRAQQRKEKKSDIPDEYGMPQDYAKKYCTLAKEIEDFYDFMTKPSTKSQEDPIRPATAIVYKRHALLFLGWYVKIHRKELSNSKQQIDLSINDIIRSKEKDSAESILEFLLWLRTERQISVSYEANFLRGLTKLLKFRFRDESHTDTSYGVKSFDDIPVVRELRKLHRDANKRQSSAPRSSDEDRKWISWPEYLQVVQKCKVALEHLLEDFQRNQDIPLPVPNNITNATPAQRKIAVLFQKYLILAFFANIPDRQRTVRELELGRSFIKDKKTGAWCVRHTPEDYKTGNAYGERPLLALPLCLSPAIDEFIEVWRNSLKPQTNNVFCQVRTGKALTQDSVYQIVARTCYEYTGKRTNPHLLRDMIVTHVRESSEASEKQLEALALFMGHSINIQRSSYDRRTLSTKVAPAVELIQSVNSNV